MFRDHENKMMTVPEDKADRHGPVNIIDGTLGGCGMGPEGDPNTYLPAVWECLMDLTDADSVLDVGCGLGYSTRWFEGRGLRAVGVEGSKMVVGMAVTGAVCLHDFTEGRIRGDYEFDLCWCSEFLEHVPAEYEPNIFAAFARCRYVAVSAALPGFGGHNHVNEQTSEYWIARFEGHGFSLMREETDRLRAIALESVPRSYFPHNGLLFRREHVVEPGPRLWTDVEGWLYKRDGDVLRELAAGKRVLELGGYKGRSTVCMAQVAKELTSIDHHRGNDDEPEDTSVAFERTIAAFGLGGKVEPIRADFRDLGTTLEERRYHLVFVDGAHDAASVERDTVIALEALLPGGAIVWHDWDDPRVKAGVLATGIPEHNILQRDTLGILRTRRNQVLVCMPHSGNVEMRAAKAAYRACQGETADMFGFLTFSYGCLTHNFNVLLSEALCQRDMGQVTHMAMLHSDVCADHGWADVLSEEACLTRAAAISAVVTIKDPDDDRTSTAIGDAADPWVVKRFVRLRDRATMPATFTGDDVCEDGADEVLLINTGCMLLDLSYPFWDDFVFEVRNRVLRDGTTRQPQFEPEDWRLSRQLHAASLPYAATWRVKTTHVGANDWDNRPRPGFLSNSHP